MLTIGRTRIFINRCGCGRKFSDNNTYYSVKQKDRTSYRRKKLSSPRPPYVAGASDKPLSRHLIRSYNYGYKSSDEQRGLYIIKNALSTIQTKKFQNFFVMVVLISLYGSSTSHICEGVADIIIFLQIFGMAIFRSPLFCPRAGAPAEFRPQGRAR